MSVCKHGIAGECPICESDRRAAKAEYKLAAVQNWTLQHGAALVPHGWADSFGEGMRLAKLQVQALLAGIAPLALVEDRSPEQLRADGDDPPEQSLAAAQPGRLTNNAGARAAAAELKLATIERAVEQHERMARNASNDAAIKTFLAVGFAAVADALGSPEDRRAARANVAVLDAMAVIPTLVLQTWIDRGFETVVPLARAELARRGVNHG